MNSQNVNFLIQTSGADNWKVSKLTNGRTKRVFVSPRIGDCFDYVIRIALDEDQARNARLAAVTTLRSQAANRVVEMLDMAHAQALLEHEWYNENCEELPTGHQCDIDEDGYCRDARCPKSCAVDIEEAAAAEPSPEPAAAPYAQHLASSDPTVAMFAKAAQSLDAKFHADPRSFVFDPALHPGMMDEIRAMAIEEDYQRDSFLGNGTANYEGFTCSCGEPVKDEGQSCGSCASDAVMHTFGGAL